MLKKRLLFVGMTSFGVLGSSLVFFKLFLANQKGQDISDLVGLWIIMLMVIGPLFYGISARIYMKISYAKINNVFFKTSKIYFRDIIKKYSIAELSFIDGFEFDYFYDVVAMLLKLEKLKVIKIENEKIVILNHNVSLKNSERYLLSGVIDGHLAENIFSNLPALIEKECVEDNLIEIIDINKSLFKRDSNMNIMKWIAISLALFAIACLVSIFAFDLSKFFATILLYLASFLLLMLILVFPVVFFVRASMVSGEKGVRYRLTDSGKKIYDNLCGLKNYIKNFSNLGSAEKEHLKLWDDYLIYSVMFKINKQIPDKYLKILKLKPDIPISTNSNKGIRYKP